VLQNPGEIFRGTSKAPVKSYIGDVARLWAPERMIHPSVGKFGALGACVKGGVSPSRHHASDLNLYTSVLGTLADPASRIADLNLVPRADVQPFFVDCDLEDDIDFAARVLLGMKYVQLNPKNRFVESQRRDLLVRQDHHLEQLKKRLARFLDECAGIHYRAANLWDVLAELEAEPPTDRAMLYTSLTWYEGDFSAQMEVPEAMYGWPGLVGREFSPDTVPELLERANAVPGLAVVAHLGAHLRELVPESFQPVMAYMGGRGEVDHLYSNVDLTKYAPQKIRRLDPRNVEILSEQHVLTRDSRCEIVKLDTDTALYLRDLFVHRLGRASTDCYLALCLDGKVAAVYGLLLTQILGAGHPTTYINEVFGVVRTIDAYPRLNRLAPYALTSGDTKRLLLTKHPGLQGREVDGIQSTDIRKYADSKNKRGIFKGFRTEKQPDGTFKIISRGLFRDDTWQDCYAAWWDKWSADALEARRVKEEEQHGRGRRRRNRRSQSAGA
jgi:hypothetical protein